MGLGVRGPGFRHTIAPTAPTMFTKSTLPLLRVVGQVSNTYIVAEGPDGMYLVDQHAAHERVLFERVLKERLEKASPGTGNARSCNRRPVTGAERKPVTGGGADSRTRV